MADEYNGEDRIVKQLMSSEESDGRKGAFAVCSPRTAAKAAEIYDDGANGGVQAASGGVGANMSQVSYSQKDDENISDSLQGKPNLKTNYGIKEASQPYTDHM